MCNQKMQDTRQPERFSTAGSLINSLIALA